MKKLLAALAVTAIVSCSPNHQPWEKGAIETGEYRNLFLEYGYSQKEIDKKLDEIFNDVFYGPNRIYFPVGDSLGYISDIKNNDVRTEGMSYGMMVAVELDKKDIFDRLWRWAKLYMQHQDGERKGYFAWSCKTDGTRNAEGSASDGELYFITSLIFASNRWGNNSGINYKAEAQNILNCSMQKKDTANVTPLINSKYRLINFTPDKFGNMFTDPSYHIPAFYEVWAKWADDGQKDFWLSAADSARAFLHKATDKTTGLNPDFCMYDGSLFKDTRFKAVNNFRYDSWRVPMNIALDYEWSCTDGQWQRKYAEKIQNFFYSQGIKNYVDQYRIDGSLPDTSEILQAGTYPKALRHSVGLVSTLAATSIMNGKPQSKEFADELWNLKHQPLEDGYFDAYYDGFLRLFAFMHLSGKYRIIEPQNN